MDQQPQRQATADWGGGSYHLHERCVGPGMRTDVDSHTVIIHACAALVGETTQPQHANGLVNPRDHCLPKQGTVCKAGHYPEEQYLKGQGLGP